jgi:hypothetical protein
MKNHPLKIRKKEKDPKKRQINPINGFSQKILEKHLKRGLEILRIELV